MALKTISVKIAQMDSFFAYAPLYYAEENGFFDCFDTHKYKVEIAESSDSTDIAAYKDLMNDGPNNEFMFAVCDPTVILDDTTSEFRQRAMLLGAMITSYAFWALNRRTQKVPVLDDLAKAYETIICYQPGTTSYAIANKLFEAAASHNPNLTREQYIDPVSPRQEFDRLAEYYKKNKSSVVLITPDIPGVLNYSKQFPIVYNIMDSADFGDALVTALLTRRDVFARYPDLVNGLSEALQIGLIKTWNELEDVARTAGARTGNNKLAKASLEKAIEHGIYPKSIEVKPAMWERAARIMSYARGVPLDSNELSDYMHVYDQVARDYAPQAASIFRRRASEFGVAEDSLEIFDTKEPYPRGYREITIGTAFSYLKSHYPEGRAVFQQNGSPAYVIQRASGPFKQAVYVLADMKNGEQVHST